MTVNHEYTRTAHLRHMATEKAPGPPMLPRRRLRMAVVHWLFVLLTAAVLTGLAAFALLIVGFLLTGRVPQFI